MIVAVSTVKIATVTQVSNLSENSILKLEINCFLGASIATPDQIG